MESVHLTKSFQAHGDNDATTKDSAGRLGVLNKCIHWWARRKDCLETIKTCCLQIITKRRNYKRFLVFGKLGLCLVGSQMRKMILVLCLVIALYGYSTSVSFINVPSRDDHYVRWDGKELPLCPSYPGHMKGVIHVNQTRPTWESLRDENPDLMSGGHWKPLDCIARHKVAIVIPYRNRETNLLVFLQHIHPFLKKQKIEYTIFVAEQAPGSSFNRGLDRNVGFVEANKLGNFDCTIFHDVDLLPIDDRNLYYCPDHPRHMCVAANYIFDYMPLYNNSYALFGGVVSFRNDQFRAVNGYSNIYFGWGAEDDDLHSRIVAKGMPPYRFPDKIGRYFGSPHNDTPIERKHMEDEKDRMASSSATTHDRWMTRANAEYEKARALDDRSKKMELMKKALHYYGRALKEASDDMETFVATNAFAMLSLATASLQEETEDKSDNAISSYRNAIRHFSKAILLSARLGLDETEADIVEVFEVCIEDALTIVKRESTKKMSSTIESYIWEMEEDSFKPKCFIVLIETLFNNSVFHMEHGEMRTALNDLRGCQRPIAELRKIWQYVDEPLQLGKLQDLEESIKIHTYSAEAQQAIAVGDKLLEKTLKESEAMDMDKVFDVVDLYGKAVFLTKEHEIVTEAKALSRLGKVFDKVLKQQDKARVYFNRAIQLAQSLQPRSFNNEEWFKTCLEALNRYQQEQSKKEEAEAHKERVEILAEIKEEMATLDNLVSKHKDGRLEMLCAIHEKFPPKNTDVKFPTYGELQKLDAEDINGYIKKAMKNFHPNKNPSDEYGKKWTVLCDEITKVLLKHFPNLRLSNKELVRLLETSQTKMVNDLFSGFTDIAGEDKSDVDKSDLDKSDEDTPEELKPHVGDSHEDTLDKK